MGVPGSINNLLGAAPASYKVERSLRFNSSDSGFCSRTFTSAGNRTTWSFSCWVKRAALGANNFIFAVDQATTQHRFGFTSADKLAFIFQQGECNIETTAVFRDPSAWYHILLVSNTGDSDQTKRIRIYVNGTEQATGISGFAARWPTSGEQWAFNNNIAHSIGRFTDTTNAPIYSNIYLSEIWFVGGSALTPSDFAENNQTTGQWIPKRYTGSTAGTNTFQLTFSDNSSNTATTLGKDTSGNGNNWTPFNLQTTTGGPTSVAAASGALPIYNTTDTYGATKGSGTRTDANASSLSLAIPMDGANNGTTFTDESATIRGSGSAKAITRNGDTKTVTAQSKYYGSSGYFDGNGDSLTGATSTDLNMGSGDFTVECWVRWDGTSTPYQNFVGSNSGSFTGNATFFRVWGTSASPSGLIGKVGIGNPTHDSTSSVYSTTSLTANVWTHVAAVRSSGVIRLYINGILDKTGSSDTSTYDFGDNGFCVGASPWDGANGFYSGYIQDLRVYKGVGKYTSNFNPPSSTQNATVAAGNDSLVDTPSSAGTDSGLGGQVTGNYCTWNPLDNSGNLSNGNLDFAWLSASERYVGATVAIPASGKWFYEETMTSTGFTYVGIAVSKGTGAAPSTCVMYRGQTGAKNIDTAQTSYGATFTNGDIIGVAVNADANTITFYKNGVSQGDISYTLTGKVMVPYGIHYQNSTSANFGQRPFAFPVSGFKALCDTNLPAPVVAKSSSAFNVLTRMGYGSAGGTVTGLNFEPDLIWEKPRNVGPSNNYLFDAIRGLNAGPGLKSNATDAESSSGSWISGTTSTGYTTNSNDYGTTVSVVAWCWDAGTSTVTNTQGSITSSCRTNQSSGFSIATFTAPSSGSATIGHNLNAEPHMIIIKSRDQAYNWCVYHKALTSNAYFLNLNTTAAQSNTSNVWNNTTPTSTVFSLGSGYAGAGATVAYLFSPVAGYSSFGSFNGNSSTDGPFQWCGFRPRWILLKNASDGYDGGGSIVNSHSWVIYDAARNTYNAAGSILAPNKSFAEENNLTDIDILSNGFKIRTNRSSVNPGSTQTVVWAAFAESPFQYARAR